MLSIVAGHGSRRYRTAGLLNNATGPVPGNRRGVIRSGWSNTPNILRFEPDRFCPPFDKKKGKIKALKKSEINMTKEIANKISNNGYLWGKREIEKRQRELLKLAYKEVWNL